jgi:hypothetical protein
LLAPGDPLRKAIKVNTAALIAKETDADKREAVLVQVREQVDVGKRVTGAVVKALRGIEDKSKSKAKAMSGGGSASKTTGESKSESTEDTDDADTRESNGEAQSASWCAARMVSLAQKLRDMIKLGGITDAERDSVMRSMDEARGLLIEADEALVKAAA